MSVELEKAREVVRLLEEKEKQNKVIAEITTSGTSLHLQ